MDPAASGSQVFVLFHQIHQQSDGVRLEVDVAVERQQERVFGDGFLALDGNRQLHQPVSEQVVHVHDLAPPFPVTDLRLVFDVHGELGFPR